MRGIKPVAEVDSYNWVHLDHGGASPGKRSGQTLVPSGGKCLLFGGLDASVSPPIPSGELYLGEVGPASIMWSHVEPLSKKPPSRWLHTMTMIQKSKFLLFGGFLSEQIRLNDTWIYDQSANAWSQPESVLSHAHHETHKSGSIARSWKMTMPDGWESAMLQAPKREYLDDFIGKSAPGVVSSVDSSDEAPFPRGGHSATVIGEYLYIFGGYGGSGYSRRDFNDIHRFNIEKLKWEAMEAPSGVIPGVRSGHVAFAMGTKMLIIGGWNSSERFKDTWVYETLSNTWSQLETATLPAPRWGHSGFIVNAVPYPLIFIAGGHTEVKSESVSVAGMFLPSFASDVLCLETNSGKWTTIETVGKAPKPTSDLSVIYDAEKLRLITYGGWNQKWYADINALSLFLAIGPPYAVTHLENSLIPITGGVRLSLHGMGFVDVESATIRMTVGKKTQDFVGEVKSKDLIETMVPALDSLGQGAFDIRVGMKSLPFTISSVSGVIFNVTDASLSYTFGPGIINNHRRGSPVSFIIQAVDIKDRLRFSGGDEFEVMVTATTDLKKSVAVDVGIVDQHNGRYIATYTSEFDGEMLVHVSFKGTFGGIAGPLPDSPFRVKSSIDAAPEINEIHSSLLVDFLNQQITSLNNLAVNTLEGLSKDVPEDSLDALLAVKTHLSSVFSRDQAEAARTKLCRGVIEYFRSVGRGREKIADRSLRALDTAVHTWDEAKKRAPATKSSVQPLVKKHAIATKLAIEDFEQKSTDYAKGVSTLPFWEFETRYDPSMRIIADAEEKHESHLRKLNRMNQLAKTFEFPLLIEGSEKIAKAVGDDFASVKQVWDLVKQTNVFLEGAKDMVWATLKSDILEENSKNIQKTLRKLPSKRLRESGVYKGLDKSIKDFLVTCPLITDLRHQSMRPRHWDRLKETTKKTFTAPYESAELKLRDILSLKLHECITQVEDITDQALKEEKLETNLKLLETTWTGISFATELSREGSTVYILKMAEEDFELLEAHQLLVQGMIANRYMSTFKEGIVSWKESLSLVSDVRGLLNDIQTLWKYLEPLFIASDEVRRELPDTTKEFEVGDTELRGILAEAKKALNVKLVCTKPGLLKSLEGLNKLFERCKKSLDDFLAQKRAQFPRFYFVSDPDLLDILSNGNEPIKVLKHVTKIFLATDKIALTTDESHTLIASKWFSCVGAEDVEFIPSFPLKGKVETYLQAVLDNQRKSLYHFLDLAIKRCSTQKRVDWLMHRRVDGKAADPAQLSLLVAGMNYVRDVEISLDKLSSGDSEALKRQHVSAVDQLNDLIRLTRTDLLKSDRTRVMCLITLDAHGRDIIDGLMRDNVIDKKAFQWQSQLKQRYENNKAVLAICDAKFDYMFEYLGNGPRLVVTPLTDRIYVTATQALNLKMGCAPAGPAGTGKTETTKDLANAVAIVCYVFNCSPEHDYTSLGNIFKGLAASGGWGCFDEFNRLVPSVLSVCSVQFKAVCDGIRQNRHDVTINGETVHLEHTAGAFITMNPGYLGRSELPEQLKALFRPITVMVPDLVLICENMLMAEGFEEAKLLASKFYGLYSLLSELLSKQKHYDWGLRAVKSVLVVAGAFKRAEPDIPEQHLLMRALRDFNTPKIVKQDEAVFFGLLGDLFPGIDPPRKVSVVLEEAVKIASIKRGLDPDAQFLLKVVQLEELLEIRHCIFILGSPSCGKSQCWQTLAEARKCRTENPLHTKYVDLDPKAVSPEELYGYIHPATRDWKDGLLSCIMRDLGDEPNTDPKWILLDGDLDTNWIESMNSVMDDNKTLTLASNERIPLKAHMRMIFEIRDLDFASPATVSRAGIIFISTNTGSQWRSLIRSWLRKLEQSNEVKNIFQELFFNSKTGYCDQTLLFIRKECRPLVPVEEVTLITNLLRFLDCLLTPQVFESLQTPELISQLSVNLETYFLFAAVWAFGSTLSERDGEDYRDKFSNFWKNAFRSVRIPSRDTIFDYWLDPEVRGFDIWKKSPYFKTIDFDSTKMSMSQITVPTTETCSVTFWMNLLVAKKIPVMLVGNSGCGKTQLVNGLLQSQDRSVRTFSTINFNFYTDSRTIQATLEAPLEKKTSTTYGPPGTVDLIYFLDDVNLPEVDKYNTQSAIALIRQHFDYGHWYERSKFTQRNVINCQYIACMNPTAGSFYVNPRLQRHFATFALGFPGPQSLTLIYETFLQGHLNFFPDAVKEQQTNILTAALQLHQSVALTFRKSAVNFHYEFNIRHLSNVFQGILTSQPVQFSDPSKLALLWLHESERVYGDRLVNLDDLAKYRLLAKDQVKRKLNHYTSETQMFFAEKPEPLIFCHFSESVQDKVYDYVKSADKLRVILEDCLRDYNENFAAMNLVLFEDAMKHVCRIARIVNNSGGHALLVGVGGSGKQSLARLAAFICGYSVFQITINSLYGLSDFREDLKKMYKRSGVKDEGIMFLFNDSQITNERFLVYINDLLASGNIPDLFAIDEVDEIVNALTSKVKAEGLTPDRAICWDYFIKKVRINLHVVLCFSPVGDDFRLRAKKFPAIVNCTVIDWFHSWPKEALFSVGQRFLSTIPDLGTEAEIEGISKFLPYSFEAVNQAAKEFFLSDRRYVYTTPKSFLELLKLYSKLLSSKNQSIEVSINRLDNGLTKLAATAETVERIEADLKITLEAAEQKKIAAESLATEVSTNRAIVEKESMKAAAESEKCRVIAAEVTAAQQIAETNLEKAEPAVAAAAAALDRLNERDLANCRTMLTPPSGVPEVFIAVMVLLAGINPVIPTTSAGKVKDKDRTWEQSKKLLLTNVRGFLDILLNYKRDVDDYKVPDINWKEIRPYLAREDFTSEAMLLKNSAAAGLCDWAINIVTYHDILITVEPLRLALREANEKLQVAEGKRKESDRIVKELEDQLAILTAQFATATKEKEDAIAAVERGQAKLSLANRLTTALADENVRWKMEASRLRGEKTLLVGDVLLSSAFISYIGPFTKKYRDDLIKLKWIPFLEKAAGGNRIPMSMNPLPLKILTTDAQIATWNSQGLPDDQVSKENGCIVVNSDRWPLMIDPQLQGIKWILKKEGDNGLIISRLGQKDLLRKIEFALQEGKPFLIENMGERIDAILNPVIARSISKRGGRMSLKLGDKDVDYNPSFKLYLHTKLSNPHFPPEVQAEVALVNFTVTEVGLEDQLLAMVVQKERPDLALQKSELIEQQNSFKIKIYELEDLILQKLADAEGDITEDVQLIESLENTKGVANEIASKQKIAQETEQNINVTSEKYRPAAHRGSLLFFLMNDLVRLHTYYTYSLASFVKVFLAAIDEVSGENDPMAESVAPTSSAGGEEEGEDSVGDSKKKIRVLSDEQYTQRCKILIDSTTFTTFKYIQRSLLERDKLTTTAMMCFRFLIDNGTFEGDLIRLLVVGSSAPDPGSMGSLAEWLPANLWSKVKALEKVKPTFEKLGDDMQSESDSWRKYFDHEKPETLPIPGTYKVLSSFYTLLILRALRPDRMSAALTEFVALHMGEKYTQSYPLDMPKTYAESDPSIPVFFVLFPGVDPTVWVEELGRKNGISSESGKFINISMGQGQEENARIALEKFASDGGWIMLQNVHLMQEWLPKLERQLEQVSTAAHADFRCFISAEPPPLATLANMPESLMQSCIKVANEAPADLRSNLIRAWATFSEAFIAGSSKPVQFKGCLFTLSFYHAIVLGRRRFGQQGWSKRYSFNTGDLTVCANVLLQYVEAATDVPWDDLRYIFGEIMYGGHITDSWDRRTNNTYLQVLLKPETLRGDEIAPGFKCPDMHSMTYEDVANYITSTLPLESPVMYGLHPNAEIGYLTSYSDDIFKSIIVMSASTGFSRKTSAGPTSEKKEEEKKPAAEVKAASGGAAKKEEEPKPVDTKKESSSTAMIRATLEIILERLPVEFIMIDLEMRAEPLLLQKTAPFTLVALQECIRMNLLLSEIRRSLIELRKGLDGQLNMSEPMEDLQQALYINQVPGRNVLHKCSWEKYAWASKRSLMTWFQDLIIRYQQLEAWSNQFINPYSIWLPGLFNPMAYLTAVMQITARNTGLPLDKMTIDTYVTTMMDPSEATYYAEDGTFVHGIFMEGARWTTAEEADAPETIGKTPCTGNIIDAKLKDLLPKMPVMYVRAVPVMPSWNPQSVGYIRNEDHIYECPLYTTTFRGPTYVFLCTLNTKHPKSYWTRAGVALIMQEDD